MHKVDVVQHAAVVDMLQSICYTGYTSYLIVTVTQCDMTLSSHVLMNNLILMFFSKCDKGPNDFLDFPLNSNYYPFL